MRIALLLAGLAGAMYSQSALQEEIRRIAADAQGKVSVACALPGTVMRCDLDPRAHPPMQSVFKLPLAVTVLHLVESGRLKLDQQIRFLASDRFVPHAYSPLQDQYPNADVDVRLRELLRLTVSLSDNAAADILLRVIGGTRVVDDYVRSLGMRGFHLEDNEHALHREVQAQYRNWFEPESAVQFLRLINDRSPLSAEHTGMLFEWMKGGAAGTSRLKSQLPPATVVMHKAGNSDVDAGVAHATNDIGLIVLPDGRLLAIAVFVTDSTADELTRNGVIGRIARAAYNAATRK